MEKTSILHKITNMLIGISNACLDFLFPRKPEVLNLESFSSGELLSILSPATAEEDESVIALFDYKDSLARDMVWELKYGGNRKIAEKLGAAIYDTICDELYEKGLLKVDTRPVIVPIPISDRRRFERGWNQTELLAEAVKKCDEDMRFKYLPRQLVKFVHTESQTQTSGRAEREENIKNSMRVLNPSKVEGRHIILIDDVCTTGATFKEAKRALKEAGAAQILCVAITH